MPATSSSMPHSSVPRTILKVPPSPHCSFHEFWVSAERMREKRAQKQTWRGASYLDEPVLLAVLLAPANHGNGMAAEGSAGGVLVYARLV